jgi:hypothetical protein
VPAVSGEPQPAIANTTLPIAQAALTAMIAAHRGGARAAARQRHERGEGDEHDAGGPQPRGGQAEQVLERARGGEVGDAVQPGDGGVEDEGGLQQRAALGDGEFGHGRHGAGARAANP